MLAPEAKKSPAIAAVRSSTISASSSASVPPTTSTFSSSTKGSVTLDDNELQEIFMKHDQLLLERAARLTALRWGSTANENDEKIIVPRVRYTSAQVQACIAAAKQLEDHAVEKQSKRKFTLKEMAAYVTETVAEIKGNIIDSSLLSKWRSKKTARSAGRLPRKTGLKVNTAFEDELFDSLLQEPTIAQTAVYAALGVESPSKKPKLSAGRSGTEKKPFSHNDVQQAAIILAACPQYCEDPRIQDLQFSTKWASNAYTRYMQRHNAAASSGASGTSEQGEDDSEDDSADSSSSSSSDADGSDDESGEDGTKDNEIIQIAPISNNKRKK
jgi:hypothetical protein